MIEVLMIPIMPNMVEAVKASQITVTIGQGRDPTAAVLQTEGESLESLESLECIVAKQSEKARSIMEMIITKRKVSS
jgi:hypothetical protein